ncbi:hypothetical protein HYX14_06790 [Candidatus Woesearchaeota archaeon]|nr:hypothetical protein [Candidatus Woesearchaeota archaeon]
MTDCALCEIPSREEDQGRIIRVTNLAYSVMNYEPLMEGHALVIPRRHTRLGDLTLKEACAINEELVSLTDRLLALYPHAPPIIWTVSDTPHASIPSHFHYHIIPSEVGVRNLMANFYPHISSRKRAEKEELEQIASKLR